MILPAFQNLCPINRAIVNSEHYTCIHKNECPITECEFCEIDEDGTYGEKVKWIEWVEGLIAAQSPWFEYHPVMPRVDPKIFEEI